MKYKIALFSTAFLGMLAGIAYAESLLQPASFPKTVNDTSFVDRMELLAEGYQDYDTEYDENGVCISGCPYKGIKMEDEIAATIRATEEANARLSLYKKTHPEGVIEEPPQKPEPDDNTPPKHNDDNKPPKHNPDKNPPSKPNPDDKNPPKPPVRTCTNYSPKIRPGVRTVSQPPLDINLVITSDFGPRRAPKAGASTYHAGLDLSAQVGTNVYSPATGTVIGVWQDSTCGKAVKIQHADGLITVYCHLSQQLVKKGDKIDSGCLIAKSGNTGNSTGPHLHYAIKDQSNNKIDPLWEVNRLGVEYTLKKPSSLHSGKNLPGRKH